MAAAPVATVLSESDAAQLDDLRRRVEALERSQSRHRHSLAAYNARRAAAAGELHRAIAAAMGASPEPQKLSAKQVIRALDLQTLGCPEVSLRTVRHHMQAIRRGA